MSDYQECDSCSERYPRGSGYLREIVTLRGVRAVCLRCLPTNQTNQTNQTSES